MASTYQHCTKKQLLAMEGVQMGLQLCSTVLVL